MLYFNQFDTVTSSALIVSVILIIFAAFSLCYQSYNSEKRFSSGRYVGAMSYFRRHGHGTMYYNNGDVYSGEWVKDNRTGEIEHAQLRQCLNKVILIFICCFILF